MYAFHQSRAIKCIKATEESPFTLLSITMEQFISSWTVITLHGMPVHQSGTTIPVGVERLLMLIIQSIKTGIKLHGHGARPLGNKRSPWKSS